MPIKRLLRRAWDGIAWRVRKHSRPFLSGTSRLVDSSLENIFRVEVFRDPDKARDPLRAIAALRNWSPRDVIFDVGANDGRTALRLQKHYRGVTIHSFEPVASTYDELARRTRRFPNVHPHQLALGSRSGTETIYIAPHAVCNSFLPEWSDQVGAEEVEVRTIDEMMKELGVDFVSFLKVDTEGFELEVLKGARKALDDSRIDIIQLEVGHDRRFALHTPFDEVKAYLEPRGYFLYRFFNQVTRARRLSPVSSEGVAGGFVPKALKYCDAVFVSARLEPGGPDS